MKHYKLLHVFAFFVLANFAMIAQSKTLESLVDRTKITIEETVNLTVKYTGGQARNRPNFSELQKQWEILSQNHNSQYRSINGKTESFTEWQFILAPKSEGILFIPTFEYASVKSQAKTIKVTPPGAKPAGHVEDVFVETIINKEQAFVQEQVKLSYRLYYAVNVDSLEAEPLELDNAIVEQLPEARYRREIDGKMFNVIEYSYAIFPQTSDTLKIPTLNWSIRIAPRGGSYSLFDRMGRFEIKRTRTDEKSLTIKQQPANFPNHATWLPAKSLKISERWSKNPSGFQVGEPLTREIIIEAEGLMASQLPILNDSIADTDRIKYYADQPTLNSETTNQGVQAIRKESAAIVITQSGETTIPGIKIPWWDVDANTLRYAELPERKVFLQQLAASAQNPSLKNLPPLSKANDDTTLSENNADNLVTAQTAWLWQLLSVLFGLLSASFFMLWKKEQKKTRTEGQYRAEKNRSEKMQIKRAFSVFEKHCQNNNSTEARKALISWAKTYWANEHIHSLKSIGQKMSPEIQSQLQQLDNVLFAHHASTVNLTQLSSEIAGWCKSQKGVNHPNPTQLAPLYQTG